MGPRPLSKQIVTCRSKFDVGATAAAVVVCDEYGRFVAQRPRFSVDYSFQAATYKELPIHESGDITPSWTRMQVTKPAKNALYYSIETRGVVREVVEVDEGKDMTMGHFMQDVGRKYGSYLESLLSKDENVRRRKLFE